MFSILFEFHLSKDNSSFFINPSVELLSDTSSFSNNNDTSSSNLLNVRLLDDHTTIDLEASDLFVDSQLLLGFSSFQNDNKPTRACQLLSYLCDYLLMVLVTIYLKQNIPLIFFLELAYQIIKLSELLLRPMLNCLLQKELFEMILLFIQYVGRLICLTTTPLDITYIVHIVNQFIVASCTIHFVMVLRILWYIKSTLFHGLYFFAQSSSILHAFSDVDYVGD